MFLVPKWTREVVVARAREVARGGGDVREREIDDGERGDGG